VLLDQASRAMERHRSRRPPMDGFRPDSSVGLVSSGFIHWQTSEPQVPSRSLPLGATPSETFLADGLSPLPVQSTGAESMTESCLRCAEVRGGGGGRRCIRVPKRRADESRAHSRRCSTRAFHSGPASAGYAMSGRSILHTYSSRRKWLERRRRPEGHTVSKAISTVGYYWAGYAGGRLSGQTCAG